MLSLLNDLIELVDQAYIKLIAIILGVGPVTFLM